MWLKGVCLIDIPLFSFYWLQNETYCAGMSKHGEKNEKLPESRGAFVVSFVVWREKTKRNF